MNEMISLVVATRRKSSLSPEAYSERWRNGHGELVKQVPEFLRHVRRYSQYHIIRDSDKAGPDDHGDDHDGVSALSFTAEPDDSGEDYDGVSVLSFDDESAMLRAFREPRYINEIRPDDEDFTDFNKSTAFLVKTYPMYESVSDEINGNIS